jgi:UTP--glucose-1-phosphate uridylyltransferase
LPAPGSELEREARTRGLAAIDDGRVIVIVLGGGLGTRFGGGVKGLVSVGTPPRPLLWWKIGDALRYAGARVMVMSSEATHSTITAWLADASVKDERFGAVDVFVQSSAVRQTPEGRPLVDEQGNPDRSPAGHGDLPRALKREGLLDDIVAKNGPDSVVMISNSDNIGARLDPVLVGMHEIGGQECTLEVVRRTRDDTGGGVAVVDGRARLLEDFQLPPEVAPHELPLMSTNTWYVDVAALERSTDLPVHRVRKRVDGAEAVQAERLLGDLTGSLSTQFLCVPRDGPDSRFLPVKTREDLASVEEFLRRTESSSSG